MTPTRPVAITPMKARVSGGLRKLSGQVADAFPEMNVHQHLQDAAREVDAGRTHSAQRHVHAAIFGMTPLQMHRHGVHDDAGHMRGKAFMQQAYRHLLLVKDIEDVGTSNDGIRQQRRDDRDQQQQERAMRTAARTNPPPVPKANLDTPPARQAPSDPSGPRLPQAGQVAASWSRHLQVIELIATPHHETAAGRRALQAKGHTAYGTSFPVPNVSYLHKALRAVGRVAPGKRQVLKRFLQKRAKQLGVSHHLKGTWADPGASPVHAANPAIPGGINLAYYGIPDEYVVELVGPKGYIHGWIKVGEQAAARAGRAVKRNIAENYPKPVTGRTESTDAFQRLQRLPEASRGRLGIVGSAAESVTGGAWAPLEPDRRFSGKRAEALRASTGMPTGGNKARRALTAVRGEMAQRRPSRLARVGRAVERGLESGLGMGEAVPPASKGKLGRKFEPGATPFGSKLSKGEARGFTAMMGQLGNQSWKSTVQGLEPRQQQIYAKARKAGKSHYGALMAAQGSMQMTFTSGPLPFVLDGIAS